MLADAGYPDGVSITAALPASATSSAVGAALVSGLGPAGFHLTVRTLADYYPAVGVPSRQPDLVSYAWSPDWPTASAVIPPLFTCAALTPTGNRNVANHCDRGFDAQVSAGLADPDRDHRARIWSALDRRLVEEAIVVPRGFGVASAPVGARVGHARSSLVYGGLVDLVNLTLR